MTKIPCPKCKGRRVVFDPLSLFMTIGLPFALLAEADDEPEDNSVTKKTCPTCKGTGYFKCCDEDEDEDFYEKD